MSKKRSNIEISADILKVAVGGARKSHIVYKANLNFAIIKDYLHSLTEAGLLQSPENGSKIFRTTERGIDFINYYEGFKQYVS